MRIIRDRLASRICLAIAILLQACLDGSQSPAGRPEAPPTDDAQSSMTKEIDLVYVCGNKFLATNSTRSTVHVTYRVVETSETGGLTLREGSDGDPGFSETELETVQSGTVELFVDGTRVAQRVNERLPCGAPSRAVAAAVVGPEATVGKWSAPFSWPIIALHLHLLRNGKVLSWGKFGAPQVWDPSAKTFTAIASPDWIFCAGHAFLSDGKLLVAGGHISDQHGIPDANVFDPGTMTWSTRPSMTYGRWYPTTTILGNGQAVTFAGTDQSGAQVEIPEVWNGSSWRQLTSAAKSLAYYPRAFLAPNGRVFYAGEGKTTSYLNTSGTGSWSTVGSRRYGVRDYGSAVMYQPGKILYAGGGRTTNTAEIIDLNQASPTWQWTGSMAFARRHMNATILPTGQVLVTGGTSGTLFSDESRAVLAAEMWNPATGTWTTLASNAVARVYHSTALLLKDGRVLLTGSGDADGAINHYDAELFSPPYLFQGARPKLSSAPSAVAYGETFFVETPDPAAIARVTWIRLGSVTHAFNMNQRFNELSFTRTTGGLNVNAPASRNLAPPGHYMLFILNQNGVPSTARVVRIR